MRDLQQKAIESALKCDWERAIDYNLAILQEHSSNIQALNRLAKGHMELGQKNPAKEAYGKVLKLDPYNSVALRNLKLLPQKNASANNISSEDFIENPGETKTTTLIKLADKNILAGLYIRQPVNFKAQGTLVAVYASEIQKIGMLPDDLSFKLKILLKKGYSYDACIKAVEDKSITLFIREIKRPKRYLELQSFSATTNHRTLKR